MKRSALLPIVLLTFVSFAFQPTTASAGISYTGQLDPDDPADWNESTNGYIGKTEDGTLKVNDGSELFAKYGYIGYDSGIAGSVVVDGEGSSWNCKITGGAWTPYSLSLDFTPIIIPPFDPPIFPPINPPSSSPATSLYVGYSGIGSLEIINGGIVENSIGIIGYNAGSSGTVTVSGEGSTWSNQLYETYTPPYYPPITVITQPLHYASTYTLSAIATPTAISYYDSPIYVGHSGSGELNILDGGEVINATAYIGFNVGSNGVANIDGSNTTWNNSESLYVGHSGAGTINISGSATVSVADSTYFGYQTGSSGTINFGEGSGTLNTRSLFASPSQLAGEGTINARGLVSDLDLVFDSSNGPTRTLTFNSLSDQNVTLNLDMSGTSDDVGDLGAGYHGTGSLSILEGVSVNSENGYIGFADGSTGTGVVNASTWSMSGNLTVGYCGTGSLSISNAATVSNYTGYIGHETDSVGEVNVDGSGSTWTIGDHLYVGYSGEGTLTITNGAVVNNESYYSRNSYIGYKTGATGTVTVDGPDTVWTNTDYLYVGYSGNGALNISGGATVSVNENTVITLTEGASGSINFGIGGGTLSTGTLFALPSQLTGSGTICARGLVSDANLVIDSTSGASASIVFNELADQNIEIQLDMSGDSGDVGTLGIGYMGNGSLEINDGIAIETYEGYVGYYSGASGIATIDGEGSIWASRSHLYVGNYGTGTMVVSNGAVVDTYIGHIGDQPGSTGLVTVNGNGSSWVNDNRLYIASSGDGTLNIQNGGLVSSADGYIGCASDSNGIVNIDGNSSRWNIEDCLYVGRYGSGTVNLTAGGDLNTDSCYIGNNTDGSGVITVDGNGSRFCCDEDIYTGYEGNGTLGISNGGYVSCEYGYIGTKSSGSGTVTVQGADSQLVCNEDLSVGNAGILNIYDGATVTVDGSIEVASSGIINFGSNGGTLNTRTFYDISESMTGTGAINARGFMGDMDMVFNAATEATFAKILTGDNINVTVNVDLSGDSGSSGDLTVGFHNVGTLAVRDGVKIVTANGYVGFSCGSNGMVTVEGSDSKWFTQLYVGRSGNGVVNIIDGGCIQGQTNIGYDAGSSGEVYVDGQDSRLTTGTGNYLYIGYSGNGYFGITNGASVSSYGTIIGNNVGSTGEVLVSGDGSELTSTTDVYSYLHVGYKGDGKLTISNGGTVDTRTGSIAYDSNVTGIVSVSGTGSSWSITKQLNIASSGNGTLNIFACGTVSCNVGSIAGSSSGTGVVSVDGSGSGLSVGRELYIGYNGQGTLEITDGGAVSDLDGYIGYKSGSTGMLTVSGIGSTWTNRNCLIVGYEGDGTLHIVGGATVNIDYGIIGHESDSTGEVVVNGSGTTLTSDGSMRVGYKGNGKLSVTGGGNVKYNVGYIGLNPGSTGVVIVDGAGSTLKNGRTLSVGCTSSGTLTITDGGAADNYYGYIGSNYGSTGGVTVNGTCSNWINYGDLYIGSRGDGTLNITGGGFVSAISVSINEQSLLVMDVGYESMLKVYKSINYGCSGPFTNDGTVRFLAGANVTVGSIFSPISAVTWEPTDTGIYQAVGGTWNDSTHEFTVSDVVQGNSGTQLSIDLADDQRAMIDGGASDWQLGMSFLHKTGENTVLLIDAAFATAEEQAVLLETLSEDQTILGAWNIELSGVGYSEDDPVYLSFDVGEGFKRGDLTVWHFDEGVWTEFDAMDLTVNDGWASFTATEFSGYAVTAAVPEPGTIAMLLAAAILLGGIGLKRRV